MPVHVAVQIDIPRLKRFLHHNFSVEIHWILLLRTRGPLPIQISAHQRAPVVTNNNPIWVLHRHNFKHERFPQEPRIVVITNQVIYQALHHPRRLRLTRMDSTSQNNSFPH